MEFLDQLQKDKKVAQDLVDNKIAKDIWEAYKIIHEKQHLNVPSIPIEQHTEQKSKDEEQTQESEGNTDRLAKLEEFLQRFDKFFSKFYEGTNTKIGDLTKQMNQLNQELAELRRVKEKPVVIEQSKEENEELQNTEQKEENKEEKTEFRQREGSYSPNDVSVDKIFNNSNNKMMKR
jgi:hypothetical protein